jgi:hypothetical protein
MLIQNGKYKQSSLLHWGRFGLEDWVLADHFPNLIDIARSRCREAILERFFVDS